MYSIIVTYMLFLRDRLSNTQIILMKHFSTHFISGKPNFFFKIALLAGLFTFNLSLTTITAQQYILTDDDVEVIDGVIQSCSYSFAIKEIIIPETLDEQTVTGIVGKITGYGLFENKGITNVHLPSTLLHIGDKAFWKNSLQNVFFPQSLTTIGSGAFMHNSLTEVTFEPDSYIQSIGEEVFAENPNLIEIILPSNANNGFVEYQDYEGTRYNPGSKIANFETYKEM